MSIMKEKDYKYTGYNSSLKQTSRMLRKNMTKQEKKLWYDFLSNYPIKFVRQRSIGTYIADFYCSKARLVIELDGSQHYTKEGMQYDDNRTYVINQFGVRVVRFSNNDIDKNFEGVCIRIDEIVSKQLGINSFLE